MHLSDLVFTGFNKRVAAIHRDSGQLLWQWKAPYSGYVTLLLDGDRLIVSVNGYLHALDALTGRLLWTNDLPGFGTGVASLASVRGGSRCPPSLPLRTPNALPWRTPGSPRRGEGGRRSRALT